MSKLMSVFEKFNLVEKLDNETSTENLEEFKEYIKSEQNVDLSNVEIAVAAKENNQSVKRINTDSDKNISIEDIYKKFGMNGNGVNTIFMLEKFITALPEKLPLDIKKDSVINILEASNTDLNMLINDGEKRLEILNNFAKDFSQSTSQAIDRCKAEIVKLNNLIKDYEEQIYLKESMLLEQNNDIKAETEKINNTINFFKNNN